MKKIFTLALTLLTVLTAVSFAIADPKQPDKDAVIVTTEFVPGPSK